MKLLSKANGRVNGLPCYLGAFGYTKDHWQGNLSLCISFWVNGLFAALVVAVLATHAVDQIYQSDLSERAWLAATLAVFGLSIAISVWALVGIWRSATRYQEKSGTIKSALMAKLFASVGALGLVAQL
jgi:hypothetical protein